MKLHYLMAVVIWIATVTAIVESDSHGNWSNEKELLEQNHEQEVPNSQAKEETKNIEDQTGNEHERVFNLFQTDKPIGEEKEEAIAVKFMNRNEENYQVDEPQRQFSKQVVQPYALALKNKSIPEEILSESLDNISRLTRTSQSVTNETITVEYIPSQEIVVEDSSTTTKYIPQESASNDLGQTVSEDSLDIESVGEFGQRVRPSSSFRQRNNENLVRLRPRQPLDGASSEDHRKQHRKSFRSYTSKKLNVSDNNFNVFPKERLPFTLTKTTDSQRTLKQKESEGNYTDAPFTTKDVPSSTSVPVVSVSLGKFSGPIVVPDLPRQKKYSYATTPYYTEGNEVSKTTAVPLETSRPKVSENNYLAASPIVLNPLQVGVALMNAGQDLNIINDQAAFTKEYAQDEADTPQATDNHSVSLIQSDAPDSENSSFQSDQVSQQEQISEVVASNLPTQSVEIQKSVEIFHTAPVQEIHYPVEFVPHVAQALVKQRFQEDYRKPSRGQFKDHRSNQVNVYRSNEIVDETVPLNNQERGRYEYNVNENDVIYSASSGQVEQTLAVARPIEVKPIFSANEQVDSAQYDQTVVKHSRLQGLPEASIKQNDYELQKGPSSTIAQPPRGIDGLPGLANLENPQGSQEVPQILQTKATNEPPTELRLLIAAPQPYPVNEPEKKVVPFPVEKVVEKQITIPQPFPVHVPIDRVVEKQIRIPYPVHVEKVIEKKVPFAIQRFIIPLPIHFRVPQPVPLPVEKVVEKPLHLSRPYSIEVEKSRPYSLENSKLIKSGPIYNVQSDYQQVIRQNYQPPLAPLYATENEPSYYNSTMQFYGPGYLALNRSPFRQPLIHPLPKKFGSYGIQYPHGVTYSMNNGNLVTYGRTVDKDKVKDEYVGPVPRKVQSSLGIQSKSLYSTPDIQATLRRTRQESAVGNIGSFRQSKMEYGFKPPMVPSVQYDEQTATKVE